MVPHLLRVLPVVEEHGAVRIHPGNPVAAGQILCEIVRAILLYPMGDVLCQTLQLTGDPILEITGCVSTRLASSTARDTPRMERKIRFVMSLQPSCQFTGLIL